MNKSIIFRTLVASCIALTALFAPQASAFPLSHYTQSSKLSKGNWVKIKVSESGIYQITDAQAREWGFNGVASLHVFGQGGAPLNEVLSSSIPDDLPQLPVVRSSGKLLFYAQGPTTWYYDGAFRHKLHPYSDDAYYFVTDDSSYSDIDITHDNTPVQGDAATSFTERLFHEKELANPGKVGRDMLGEDFTGTPVQTLSFDLKGKVNGSSVKVITTTGIFQTSSTGNGKFTFQYNGTNLPESAQDVFKYTSTDHLAYSPLTMTKTFNMEGEKLNYSIKLNINGAVLRLARLNAVVVNYERALSLADGQLNIATNNTWLAGKSMRLSNATSGSQVWDVTEAHNPVAMNTQAEGSNLTFATASSGLREYIAFDPSHNFPSPTMTEHVANQDIHAMEIPDMVIITNSRYMPQAQRVAQLHESQDSMRVLVLAQEAIFNEFSGGTPDFMAYRMLCKYFFDRGSDAKGHHLQYALLMGGGTFDNKLSTSEIKAMAFPSLLTWVEEDSHLEDRSINCDLAIGILKDNASTNWGRQEFDISVGRFPARSEEEAQVAVDKLIKYTTTPDFGSWRNNVIILADDEEKADFMKQCDSYINSGQKNGGQDNMFKRIYLDAYEAVSVGATRSYPAAREALYGGLKEGALVWCYNGHSSPNVISDHDIVRRNDYLNNMFYKHLPLMFATTCELSRYDAPEACGAEHMFFNKNGGAIAVISATRAAYMPQNGDLGKRVFKYMFNRDENGMPLRVGDIWRHSLNDTLMSNNLVYMLMGDPAMRLALPRYQARIDAINGQPVNPDNMPVFKARQTITVTGQIVDHKGNKVNAFNGSVQSSLYDCEQSITTHGYGTKGAQHTYQEHSNRIAISSDSVKNGDFSIKITIPSEIIYSYDNYTPSLINLYAYDANHNYDAIGSNEDFYIYGYDESIKTDNAGPQITYMGLNSENFKEGDDVNESPLLIASLYDESGINISDDGIGHSMSLLLDDKVEYHNVSKYYTPVHSHNGGYRGSISFPLNGLSNGTHTLRLRVWDIFSNMNEKTITFNVVNGLKPDIYEVYTTQNPASTETTFYVKHNRPDANINLGIQVFDLMGRLVWTTQQSGQSDMFTSFPVTWNLTDMAGNRVPRGIYVYRAIVSTDGVREATKSKKIAVTAE